MSVSINSAAISVNPCEFDLVLNISSVPLLSQDSIFKSRTWASPHLVPLIASVAFVKAQIARAHRTLHVVTLIAGDASFLAVQTHVHIDIPD